MVKQTHGESCRFVAVVVAVAVLAGGCAGPKPKVGSPAGVPGQDPRIDLVAYQYFSIGTMAYSEGDYQSATAAFEHALRLDPESAQIRFSLAQCYVRVSQLDRAIAVASAIQPQDGQTLQLLGDCYRATQRYDQALETYRLLIARDTTNAEAYWYLHRLALNQGYVDEAVRSLASAARLRGDSRLYVELGELCGRVGKFGDAAHAFEESLRRDSTAANRAAYAGLAQAHESQGHADDARRTLRRALQVMPVDVTLHKLLTNHFLVHEQFDSAVVVVQQILILSPNDAGERLRLGMLWYNTNRQEKADSLFTQLKNDSVPYIPLLYLGRIAFDRREYDKAKGYFREAISANDTIPDAWVFLANTLLYEDSLEAAVATGQKAATKVRDTRQIWYFVGRAYARYERYDSAIVWFARAYAQDSTDTRVQFALASSLERAGRFDSAAAVFNDLLSHEPDNASALNYLGYMYADSGIRLHESLSLIERALKQEPENGAYLDSFGWVLFRLGRFAEAEEQLLKALNNLKADSTLYEHLGDILAAQGRREEAKEQWREALKLKPNDPALKSKLGE
jgi:tetratricopeptide (TPR) repeat protein